MTSVPATEGSMSNPAGGDKIDPIEMPSSERSLLKTAVDTPPSSPIAKEITPHSTAALNTTKDIPGLDASKPLQPSASVTESDDSLEDGEVIEDNGVEHTPTKATNNHTTEQRDVISLQNTNHQDVTVTTTPSEDGISANVTESNKVSTAKAEGSREPETEMSTPAETLPVDSEVVTNEKGSRYKNTNDMENGTAGKGEATDDVGEDKSFGDDEDTAVETQTHETTASTLPRSVPPHMRLTFKAPNVQYPGSQVGKCDWPAPIPRAPRAYYPPVGYQPSRPPLELDELHRTRAQLMKARNDLEVERKLNAEMRKTVGAEKQASIGAAMSDMLTELLQKQAEALAAKAKTQEKDRDLHHREQKIAQLEGYLSDGQRQLKLQLEQQGIRSMSVVDEANLRREVELKVRHQFSDIEGKIAVQVERLRHQEAAQKIRERQYKALIRDALETEIREQLAQDGQTKDTNVQAAQDAYERGLIKGMQVEGAKTSEVALKQEFLKGYAACYRSQTALHNMRNGQIAADSPELAFLYDPTHSENPHKMGLSIGHMEAAAEKVKKSTVEELISHKSMETDAGRAAATAGETQTSSNAVAHCGCGRAEFNDASPSRSPQVADCSERARTAQQTHSLQAHQVQRMQREELARSPVPPRSTFAGELRGSSLATPNGIFSSQFTSQSTPTVPKTTSALTTNDVTRVGIANRVHEGVYAGRRTIRYDEDSEVEPAPPNLIDLC